LQLSTIFAVPFFSSSLIIVSLWELR